jgi:hypothetical protein
MSVIDESGHTGYGVVERQVGSLVRPPDDIRLCVADLRAALNKIISFPSIPINSDDAADLLNDSGRVAQKYACYRDCI